MKFPFDGSVYFRRIEVLCLYDDEVNIQAGPSCFRNKLCFNIIEPECVITCETKTTEYFRLGMICGGDGGISSNQQNPAAPIKHKLNLFFSQKHIWFRFSFHLVTNERWRARQTRIFNLIFQSTSLPVSPPVFLISLASHSVFENYYYFFFFFHWKICINYWCGHINRFEIARAPHSNAFDSIKLRLRWKWHRKRHGRYETSDDCCATGEKFVCKLQIIWKMFKH